eukprot:UN08089
MFFYKTSEKIDYSIKGKPYDFLQKKQGKNVNFMHEKIDCFKWKSMWDTLFKILNFR